MSDYFVGTTQRSTKSSFGRVAWWQPCRLALKRSVSEGGLYFAAGSHSTAPLASSLALPYTQIFKVLGVTFRLPRRMWFALVCLYNLDLKLAEGQDPNKVLSWWSKAGHKQFV